MHFDVKLQIMITDEDTMLAADERCQCPALTRLVRMRRLTLRHTI